MHKPYSKSKLNIKELKHLSLRLNVPQREIEKIAEIAHSLYTYKREPKEDGTERIISKPKPKLKKIQSKIHKLLTEITISDAAHGGIKGKSNLSNAQVHCDSKIVVNFDLKNFFPSISHHRVYNLFHRTLGCSPEVASILTKLTTVNQQVPQGGAMSTDIANTILREADRRLEGLAHKHNLKYTRYVDDMTFSGAVVPKNLKNWVSQIVSENGFELNMKKQKVMCKNEAQAVTGLNVNRKKPTVSRNKKRTIQSEAHIFNKFEAERLTDEERYIREKQITGKVAYLNYINKK